MKKSEKISYLVVAALGIFAAIEGYGYGYKNKNGQIGGGFLVFWVGVLLVVMAAYGFILTSKDKENTKPSPFTLKAFIPFFIIIGLSIVVLLTAEYISLLLATIVMMFGMLWLMGIRKVSTLVLVPVITGICLYVIFVILLKIPVPWGIFKGLMDLL